MESTTLDRLLAEAAASRGRIVLLTGAGISAASGIPTFRGTEGYWAVGSRNYRPEELATLATFRREPAAVWGWYLHRRGVCRAARPNAAHDAVVAIERRFGERFVLITQNVDGLHLAAGSGVERTLQVHGNLHFMRCAGDCDGAPVPVPESFGARPRGEPLDAAERAGLECARCGGWMRPHVLWFDENYDEARYRFESALAAAREAALLLVVGTSGATTLPALVAKIAAAAGAAIVDVDPDDNPFAALARSSPRGAHVRASAVDALPDLARRLAR
jgi:NAD-dependent protein deacetylase/lipoamidase